MSWELSQVADFFKEWGLPGLAWISVQNSQLPEAVSEFCHSVTDTRTPFIVRVLFCLNCKVQFILWHFSSVTLKKSWHNCFKQGIYLKLKKKSDEPHSNIKMRTTEKKSSISIVMFVLLFVKFFSVTCNWACLLF